ncbi:MAG: glycosyltransferase [Rhodoferax sp.]|nr:glycosyltransferase [Rhodoferax sp.]
MVDTINSIALQNYTGPMAVIVIYDGSTDTTASKLSELNYPWLQVMTLEKNGGKAGALNQGLAKVRSALTVTIDGDSYLYHNALNNLVRRYMSHLKKVPSLLGMGQSLPLPCHPAQRCGTPLKLRPCTPSSPVPPHSPLRSGGASGVSLSAIPCAPCWSFQPS